MEDGNRAHGLRGKTSLAKLKQQLGIYALGKWPATSPDLNPIENIWRLLKQRISANGGGALKKEELKAALQKEWDALTVEEIRKVIGSMPERVKQCQERRGYQTAW